MLLVVRAVRFLKSITISIDDHMHAAHSRYSRMCYVKLTIYKNASSNTLTIIGNLWYCKLLILWEFSHRKEFI